MTSTSQTFTTSSSHRECHYLVSQIWSSLSIDSRLSWKPSDLTSLSLWGLNLWKFYAIFMVSKNGVVLSFGRPSYQALSVYPQFIPPGSFEVCGSGNPSSLTLTWRALSVNLLHLRLFYRNATLLPDPQNPPSSTS